LSRCNSSGKVLLIEYLNKSKKQGNLSHNVSKEFSYSQKSYLSAACSYLDRRHNDEKEKIDRMRLEKFIADTDNLTFTPTISKNSRKLVENMAIREKVIQDKKQKMQYDNVPKSGGFRKDMKKKYPIRKRENDVEELKKLYENREMILKERDFNVIMIII
jgi:hypothetical protein